jgi:hypothetical protein
MKAVEPTSGLITGDDLTVVNGGIGGIVNRILLINGQTKVSIGKGCIRERRMILFLKKQEGLHKLT